MEKDKLICKSCGGNSFGEGKFDGYATLQPVSNFFSTGSQVICTVCLNCGEIASMKATKPHKFK